MEDGRNVTWRELDLISGKVYRYLKAIPHDTAAHQAADFPPVI